MNRLFRFGLITAFLCRFALGADTPRFYSQIHSFGFRAQSATAANDSLLLASDGRLYGATGSKIFSVATDGQDFRIIHDRPNVRYAGGELIEGSDGRLYAMGSLWLGNGRFEGGLHSLNKDGTGFRATTNLLVVVPQVPIIEEASDGFIYFAKAISGSPSVAGMARMNKDGSNVTIVHAFTNSPYLYAPLGQPVEVKPGVFVGAATGNGGGIYQMNLDGSEFKVLHEFGATNSIIVDRINGSDSALLLAGNRLFGTAFETNKMVIYSLNTDGSDLKIVRRLNRPTVGELVLGPNNRLLGKFRDYVSLFEMDLDGGNFKETALRDPYNNRPLVIMGTPVPVGDEFLGTAFDFVRRDEGYLFSYKSGRIPELQILRRLQSHGGDGSHPTSLFAASDGVLFGTCATGGEFNGGAIWRMQGDGSNYKVLRVFNPKADRGVPVALTEGPGGQLFGIIEGSVPDITPTNSSVFRISRAGDSYEVLHAHEGEVAKSLLAAKDGRIYVAVSPAENQPNLPAHIYSITPDGSDYKVLRQFTAAEARQLGQIVEATDGNFYVSGGASIFRVSLNGDAVVIRKDPDGRPAPHHLFEGSDGALYGYNTSWNFFGINKDGSGYWTITIPSPPGLRYETRAVEDRPGHFLVLADTMIYGVNATPPTFEALRSFTTPDYTWESLPAFGFVTGPAGAIYGITQNGGEMNLGSVYRLGDAMTSPQIAIRPGSSSSVQITTAGAIGARSQLQSASDPSGPWSDILEGFYIGQQGTTKTLPMNTNQFFRARLLEN